MSHPETIDLDSFPTPDHSASSDNPVRRAFQRANSKPKMSQPNTARKTLKADVPPSKPGEFVEPVADFYRLLAMLAMPFDPHCASVVIETDTDEESKTFGKDRAQLCAETIDAAAQKSPGLRKFLRMATTGGTWGAVIAAHTPILYAIATHHTPMMERLSEAMQRRTGGAAQ